MTRAAWGLVAAAVVLGLVFWIGRWTAPGDDGVPIELVQERIRADSLKLARVADSIQLARSRASTDSANAAARRQTQRAVAAVRTSNAYRDSVVILGDSLAELHSSAGAVDTLPVSPLIIDRLRADSATIATQASAIDSLGRAVDAAERERTAAKLLEQSSSDALAHLRNVQMPLEIEAAYSRGKRDGRKQGIVLGTIGGISITLAGAKVVQATK
jgi:transposase